MKKFLEGLKTVPSDKKLRRYKSNWLQRVTRMNNNSMTKIVLRYRPNGRRQPGRSWKSLLDEAETCLGRFHPLIDHKDP